MRLPTSGHSFTNNSVRRRCSLEITELLNFGHEFVLSF